MNFILSIARLINYVERKEMYGCKIEIVYNHMINSKLHIIALKN